MEDFQMEVRDLVTLKSQPKWFYLEPDAVKDFTNVHLISSDGFIYRFSGAMLASTSRFLRLILQEAWPETLSDDIIVQTEVPKDQLAIFHSFVGRGVLSGMTNIEPATSEAFSSFGINLNELTFEKVAESADLKDEEEILETAPAAPKHEELPLKRSLRKKSRKSYEPTNGGDYVAEELKTEPVVKIKEEEEEYLPEIPYDTNYYSDGGEKEYYDYDDDFDEDRVISRKRKGSKKGSGPATKKRPRLLEPKKEVVKKVPLEERMCICCGSVFQNRNKLARHYKSTRIKDHTDTCPHCPDVVFHSWFEHKDHVNAVHGGKFTFRCSLDDCQETFSSTKDRNAHRRTFHMLRQSHYFYFPQEGERDLTKKYQCTKCIRGFKSKTTYDQHLLRHEAEEAGTSGIFSCSLCPDDAALKYNSIADLEQHKKEAHSDMTLVCHICNKQFSKKGQLVNHIKRHENPVIRNEPVEMVCCICCGKELKKSKLNDHLKCRGPYHNDRCAYPQCADLGPFESFPQHRNHVEKLHDGVFLARCKHCPETFPNNVLRKQHIKKFHPVDSNTEGKEWVCCENCGKSVRKCYIANHMTQWHSEKDVQCSQCSEMFTSNTSLKRHVQLKHSEITCQLCGKVFPELNYKRHVWSVHTPEDQKPYVCTICTPVRGFHYKRSLDDHMNVHTGEKPNRCKTCNASYASRANLSAHIRSVHKGIKRVK